MFCAGVVYTFDAERIVRLLVLVRPLIAPGGLLAVHTFLRDTDELATLVSAQMLGGVPGGQSHGEARHESIACLVEPAPEVGRQLQRRPEWILFASPASP